MDVAPTGMQNEPSDKNGVRIYGAWSLGLNPQHSNQTFLSKEQIKSSEIIIYCRFARNLQISASYYSSIYT